MGGACCATTAAVAATACAALLPDLSALLLATNHPLQWLTTGTLATLEEAGTGVSCCSPQGLVAGLLATKSTGSLLAAMPG